MFLGKGVLKICSKFTGDHPCQSVFSVKFLCKFIEITLDMGFLLYICCLFSEHLFLRTPLDDCFCIFPKNLRQSYMLLFWQVPKYASDILRSLTKLFQVDVARLLDIHHSTIWKPPYEKCVRIRSYSGPHFSAFGLNTERYSVSLRIQSECGKMRTLFMQCHCHWKCRITPNTDTFYAVPRTKTK